MQNSQSQLIVKKLLSVCEELKNASPLEKDTIKEKLLQFVRELAREDAGIETIYLHIEAITVAGLFSGGAWEREDNLLPELVRGSFLAGGLYSLVEIASELRMLAIAKGKIPCEYLTKSEATIFLTETLALNLDFVFGGDTEESRVYKTQFKYGKKLFSYLMDNLDITDLFEEFTNEVIELAYQRPIVTDHISTLVQSGREMIEKTPSLKDKKQYDALVPYINACFSPTPISQSVEEPLDYREELKRSSIQVLEKEALNYGINLEETGIGNIHGVILIRHLVNRAPDLIPSCLGLNDSGRAQFEEHREFVLKVIKLAIRPSTANALYGLANFLERHLLSQKSVLSGIEKLVEISINPEVKKLLLKRRKFQDSITANALLVSGLISVLGQPLGIGQGRNPTCQSARGLSMWSQHNPGYLIDILISASRDNIVQMSFEGHLLNSLDYLDAAKDYFDPNLDPVSLALCPHLDALYGQILARTQFRGEDPHKWTNPALYGRLVPFGFESVLDVTQVYVKDYENFIRRFYSTHHPEYTDGAELSYANPVGIFITNFHASLLGLHAVSIQRVAEAEDGTIRVYFFNPNNEGRQNWGQEVNPSVFGNQEKMGESSLPFDEFTSRLYAFHYNPYEEGDGFAVPGALTERVGSLARGSWGKSYTWLE